MTVTALTWLLLIAIIYLTISSFVFIRNRFDLTPLPEPDVNQQEMISVCIPARNEQDTIEECVRSACEQSHRFFEVLVLDDQSSDATPQILKRLLDDYPEKLRVLSSRNKPDHWLGKPWACHQLSNAANGDLLLFIDADTSLNHNTLQRVSSGFIKNELDMLTVWPVQIFGTFWERTVIPLVYYALVTLLPAIYVYRSPRWMPESFRKKTSTLFAAACGQFIAFRKPVYRKIGGHQAVRDEIVEDVALAKLVRRHGFVMRMFEGTNSVRCRMYQSGSELWEGFRKNFFAGFSYSIPLFLIASLLHLVVFILPFVMLPIALWLANPVWLFMSTAAVTLILLQRLILALWFQWNPLYSLTHPLGVLWFQLLGLRTLYDHLTGTKVEWKGRTL